MTLDSNHDLGIRLDSPEGCELELERCSNGLATLTQEDMALTHTLSHIEDQYEQVVAIVARTIRAEADKGITATEVNAKVTELIGEDENFSKVREDLFELRADKENLERRLRTLEKRSMNAQSVLKRHTEADRAAGYGG